MMSILENNQLTSSYNTWLLVQKIENDTVWLQHHGNRSETNDKDNDLGLSNFSGEEIKASLPQVRNRSVTGFDYTNLKFSDYITEMKN